MTRKKDFWGGFKGEKPHKNFLSLDRHKTEKEKRGEKYVVVVSRESISIISISFITRKQNASLHKQQATHRED